MIVIIDYGLGNLRAISNMLTRIGINNHISNSPEDIKKAGGLVLPGNGHYDACLTSLRALDVLDTIEDRVLKNGVPFLGICVGAQMLGSRSEEGKEDGLGWLDLEVKKLPTTADLKVPNMGWRYVSIPNSKIGDAKKLVSPGSRFYFTHSYYLSPFSSSLTLLESDHGFKFSAAVQKDNIIGVQFHPEKSHKYGKQFFVSFADMCYG